MFQGVDPTDLKRPLSRKDIFLQGSIRNLPEFNAEGKDYKSYRESQISISQSNRVGDDYPDGGGLAHTPLTRLLSRLPADDDNEMETYDPR